MRERWKEKRREGCGPGRLFRFAHRACDPFAFGREGFFIVRLNRSLEAGDPAFQLLAIIRGSVFGRTAVSCFGELVSVELREFI